MKTTKYVLLSAVAGFALSGCTSFSEIHEVHSMQAVAAQGGTPFTQALTEEYRVQVKDELDEVEWSDAAWFSRKGLMAAKGEAVLPADVAAAPEGAWVRHGNLGPVVQVPPDRLPELSAAHDRLTWFLDNGGRDRQPLLAAHAQGTWDCWVEEEWEKETDIACRTEFLKLETQFTGKLSQATTTSTVAKAADTGSGSYQVFFDFDRSNISPDAARILQQAAARSTRDHVTNIKLTGHTDAAGSAGYNQALSERRADSARAELVKDGVPADEISSTGVGKGGQLVPTADGVREPQNRRTEIILQ